MFKKVFDGLKLWDELLVHVIDINRLNKCLKKNFSYVVEDPFHFMCIVKTFYWNFTIQVSKIDVLLL